MDKFDFLVFIGRFQPFHNGHMHVIRHALTLARNVIVLVGGANRARSPRNPFSFNDRAYGMMQHALNAIEPEAMDGHLVTFLPINDYMYNDTGWITQVQRVVDDAILDLGNAGGFRIHGTKDFKIGLIGHSKDSSSYYLKMFPQWGHVTVPPHRVLNATDIRREYFGPLSSLPAAHICPLPVIEFMQKFIETDAYEWLREENQFYADYKASWRNSPYPPFICCVDAVVVQSGHVLLVERAKHPGKGLLALPGGHVNPDEKFEAAVVRELKEETRISNDAPGMKPGTWQSEIPPAILNSYVANRRLFDDPHRSERGRVVTQATLFRLPDSKTLYKVRGDDDAAHAQWYKLGDVKPERMFEDHAAILSVMAGVDL
jgi:bifunctional NMN adenylyltransferase/nudix hydrolase